MFIFEQIVTLFKAGKAIDAGWDQIKAAEFIESAYKVFGGG